MTLYVSDMGFTQDLFCHLTRQLVTSQLLFYVQILPFFFLFFYFSCLVDWFLIRLLLKADRETQIVSRHAIIFDCRLLLFSSIGRFPLGCWEVQLMTEDPKRDVDCRRVMRDEMIFSTGKTIEMLPARWLRWRLVWNWFRWLRSQLLGCVHSVRDAKRNGWQTDRFHQFQ